MWRSLVWCTILLWSATSTASAHSHRDCGTPTMIRSNRRACNMFLWDAPSALLYKWCNHLLKDNLYEGRGGKLFVRFETSSVLQLLYPCSRYSPNRCLLCGGSYPDHLELWWSKHLYRPFDRQLDRTYKEALEVEEEEHRKRPLSSKYQMAKFGQEANQPSQHRVTKPPRFAFHKRYVLDATDLFDGIDKKSAKEKREIRKKTLQLAKEKWGEDVSSLTGMMSIDDHKVFILPGLKEQPGKKRPALSLVATRFLVRAAVERLIQLQHRDNLEREKRY